METTTLASVVNTTIASTTEAIKAEAMNLTKANVTKKFSDILTPHTYNPNETAEDAGVYKADLGGLQWTFDNFVTFGLPIFLTLTLLCFMCQCGCRRMTRDHAERMRLRLMGREEGVIYFDAPRRRNRNDDN